MKEDIWVNEFFEFIRLVKFVEFNKWEVRTKK